MVGKSKSLPIFLFLLGYHSVSGQVGYYEIFRTPSTLAVISEATYSCEFTNLWSGARHPIFYPSDARWSPPNLGAHSDGYSMWYPGTNASVGVENVAESGNPEVLLEEFLNATELTGDFVTGNLTFNREQQQQILPDIVVSREHPLLSSITMIAPSPDWFSGFYDYDPRNERGNSWSNEFIILTYPYDAGTEQGYMFNTTNDAEDPHKPIMQFTNETVPENGIFLNPEGTEVLPVSRWHCKLVDNEVMDDEGEISVSRDDGPPTPEDMSLP